QPSVTPPLPTGSPGRNCGTWAPVAPARCARHHAPRRRHLNCAVPKRLAMTTSAMRSSRRPEAMTRFHREQHRMAMGLTDEQMREREAYYRLRSRVDKASKAMADAAGVNHRTFSLWLVRVKGFPWRRDCTIDDLRRLY